MEERRRREMEEREGRHRGISARQKERGKRGRKEHSEREDDALGSGVTSLLGSSSTGEVVISMGSLKLFQHLR